MGLAGVVLRSVVAFIAERTLSSLMSRLGQETTDVLQLSGDGESS